jgi:NAD(P)-dependent dehydrogenase (short-subunit alcohol dehydrogenase family)
VVANDVDAAGAETTAEAIRQAGGTAYTSAHSVSDADAVAELFGWVESDVGPLDGVTLAEHGPYARLVRPGRNPSWRAHRDARP